MQFICGKESVMIFSKKVNIVNAIIVAIFLIVCGCMIIHINRIYGKADIVTNSEDNSVMWLGCKVTALNKKIYTVEDFLTAYPDNAMYKYLLNGSYDTTNYRIVVFKVNVKNTTESTVGFSLSKQVVAEAFPSAWSNGAPPISGNGELAPGADSDFEVGALYSPSLVHATHLDAMESNQFELVFSYYPEKIVLKFD